MTYVTDQTSAELREHMRRLRKMAGWHEPLADRLWKEVEALDKAALALNAEKARLTDISNLLIKSLAVALGRKPTDVKLLENPLTLALQHAAIHGASPSSVLTFTITIDRDGIPHSRTSTHGSTFAEAYAAFVKIRDEVDHQIAARRECPANPTNVR